MKKQRILIAFTILWVLIGVLMPTLITPESNFYARQISSPEKNPQGWVIVGVNRLNPERNKDNRAFQKRGRKLAKKLRYGYIEVTTGQQLLSAMQRITDQNGIIGNTVLFCHGDSLGMFFNSDRGMYDDTVKTNPYWRRFYGLKPEKALLSEWMTLIKQERIRFHPQSVSVWMTCGAGRMAQKLSQVSKINIVAATGQVVPVNTNDETNETGYYVTGNHFNWYAPNFPEAKNLGELFSPEDFLLRERYTLLSKPHP